MLFSTAGMSIRSRTGSCAAITICASPSTCAAPPMSFFINFILDADLMSSPPESKHTPLPTSEIFGPVRPQRRSMSRGGRTLARPTACTAGKVFVEQTVAKHNADARAMRLADALRGFGKFCRSHVARRSIDQIADQIGRFGGAFDAATIRLARPNQPRQLLLLGL